MDYLEIYGKFMDEYKLGMVSGEDVGIVIAKLAHLYCKYNMELVSKNRSLSLIARDTESQVDTNGKSISSSKAKIYVDATNEAHDYSIVKTNVENIEQLINALKALQKGVLGEYANAAY